MTEIRELKDYFLEQVISMLSKRNIQPAGWEEVAMKPDKKPTNISKTTTYELLLEYRSRMER